MAEGALKNSGGEHTISVTGIASPTGGTPEKPVARKGQMPEMPEMDRHFIRSGSTVTRSVSPLPARTVICRGSRSTSLILSRVSSLSLSPLPY